VAPVRSRHTDFAHDRNSAGIARNHVAHRFARCRERDAEPVRFASVGAHGFEPLTSFALSAQTSTVDDHAVVERVRADGNEQREEQVVVKVASRTERQTMGATPEGAAACPFDGHPGHLESEAGVLQDGDKGGPNCAGVVAKADRGRDFATGFEHFELIPGVQHQCNGCLVILGAEEIKAHRVGRARSTPPDVASRDIARWAPC
jgi:hypothetical protein